MAKQYKGDDLDKMLECIGPEYYQKQKPNRHLCMPVGNDAYFLVFYLCDVKNPRKQDERVSVFCGKHRFCLFGGGQVCGDIICELSPDEPIFRQLSEFFSRLTENDVDVLERMENVINEFEDGLITAKKPVKGASTRIVALRRTLLRMKRYYEQLADVLDVMSDNINGAIPEGELNRFVSLSHRLSRLAGSASHLCECVTQVREAYQAQIDIEQNQIMKIFTVLTAVFLPLTLIVGWYGMNFKIPEYGWRFGYIYVIVLSAAVCALCYFLFKKKKWF